MDVEQAFNLLIYTTEGRFIITLAVGALVVIIFFFSSRSTDAAVEEVVIDKKEVKNPPVKSSTKTKTVICDSILLIVELLGFELNKILILVRLRKKKRRILYTSHYWPL